VRRRGKDHWNYKAESKGYRNVIPAEGLYAGQMIGEHVLVAAKALGRELPPGVEVHHLNEVKGDNRNVNLVICQDMTYHKLLHKRARVVQAGGNPETDRVCKGCGVQPLGAFAKGPRSYCKKCNAELCKIYKEQKKYEPAPLSDVGMAMFEV
jgi:hypothetical protein